MPVLKGVCEKRAGSSYFNLANHFTGKFSFDRIKITPDPDDRITVQDIRIGKNSQLPSIGTFKASILNKAAFSLQDAVMHGFDVGILLSGLKESDSFKIEFVLWEWEQRDPDRLLFPAGRAQIRGVVDEVFVTDSLLEAVQEGEVAVSMVHKAIGYEYQEAPQTEVELQLKGDRLWPEKTTKFSEGHLLSFKFHGSRESDFSQQDVVAILKAID